MSVLGKYDGEDQENMIEGAGAIQLGVLQCTRLLEEYPEYIGGM